MYIDSELQLATAQAPGASANNGGNKVYSTNTINMGSNKQAFARGQASITLRVSTAFGGSDATWVEVLTSNVEDFSSGVNRVTATATLHTGGYQSLGTAGTQIDIPLPAISEPAQYLRLQYFTGSAAGSGAFDAYVNIDLQDN